MATPGDPRNDPIWIQVDVTAAPEALLELSGCGAIAWIPIGGFGAPTPTLLSAAQTGAGTIAVSWSADGPARTAVLLFRAGYGAELVHVPGTSYTFTPQSRPIDQYWSVNVQTFDAMSFLETPFGIVKIWPGGDWGAGAAIASSAPN